MDARNVQTCILKDHLYVSFFEKHSGLDTSAQCSTESSTGQITIQVATLEMNSF